MNMNWNTNKKTAALSLGAVFTAVSVVLLYFGGILPTMRIAISAVSGLFCAAMLITGGTGFSLLVYFATCLISLILLPEKTPALLYAAFFGYYPIVKYYIEKLRRLPIEWILKLFCFNFAFTLVLFLSSNIIGLSNIFATFPLYFLYPAANIVFVLYDIVFSLVIAQFGNRFSHRSFFR